MFATGVLAVMAMVTSQWYREQLQLWVVTAVCPNMNRLYLRGGKCLTDNDITAGGL